MITEQRIKELKAMGFRGFKTRNYPVKQGNRWVVDDDPNGKVRYKISVKGHSCSFGVSGLPSGLKFQLFENIWFDTPEEAWETVDWFIKNFAYTPELEKMCLEQRRHMEMYLKLEKEMAKIRKQNRPILKKIINKWQFKETPKGMK
jgi:hypothetical protein